MNEDGKAASAEAILLGRTCDACKWRLPVVFLVAPGEHGQAKRGLSCGNPARANEESYGALDPSGTCSLWQKFHPFESEMAGKQKFVIDAGRGTLGGKP